MKHASLITNGISAGLAAAGLVIPGTAGEIVRETGLFAFSGGFTNWLAIHMLFEKVPGLYGSGVIPARFEEFKGTIKQMMLKEFFDHQHIERFFATDGALPTEGIAESVDYDALFDKLVVAIGESPLGGMLSFVGGVAALQPMREPVKERLKTMVQELAENQLKSGSAIEGLRGRVEAMIDRRLAELTPDQVKRLVQDIIAEHLGWLVIWGGVFGGMIGLVTALIRL